MSRRGQQVARGVARGQVRDCKERARDDKYRFCNGDKGRRINNCRRLLRKRARTKLDVELTMALAIHVPPDFGEIGDKADSYYCVGPKTKDLANSKFPESHRVNPKFEIQKANSKDRGASRGFLILIFEFRALDFEVEMRKLFRLSGRGCMLCEAPATQPL